MAKILSLEKLFLAGNIQQLNRSDYKRLMLTGYLSIVCVLVSIIYSIIDMSSGVFYSALAYAVLLTSSFVVMLLLRAGKYSAAKIILMVNANFVVFFSAINDPTPTGTCMLFIPAGTGSFAMLGFRERWKAIVLAAFSVILFAIAFFGNVRIPHEPPSQIYITVSFIFNFVISLSIVVSIIYLLGNMNEISETELRESEKSEKKKNDQLQKINTELDQFVYSVSHDLRSPLSSIQGLVGIGKASRDTDEMKKCFALIEDRVKAQSFYSNEIIEIYRNNRAELRPERLNLKAVVRDVVKEISFESGASYINFKIAIDEKLTVETDNVRLRSILFNLIGNAIKYHDPEKAEKFILIGANQNDSEVEIFVEDNGKGIAPEHLPKIFDMFYRASEDSKGSGLGLYIVKEMATKMNGRIAAQSEIGKGTKFTLQFSMNGNAVDFSEEGKRMSIGES